MAVGWLSTTSTARHLAASLDSKSKTRRTALSTSSISMPSPTLCQTFTRPQKMSTYSPSSTCGSRATNTQVLSTTDRVSNRQATRLFSFWCRMRPLRTKLQFWLEEQVRSSGATTPISATKAVVTVCRATIVDTRYRIKVECLQA